MRKLASLTLSVALFAFSAGVVSAAPTVDITNNGSGSWNTAKVVTSNKNKTVQKNTAHFSNNVTTISSTGGNKANGNTGGDVTVSTGGSTTETTITNNANINVSDGSDLCGCPCNTGDTDVTISGNGSWSKNAVVVKNYCSDKTVQTNNAHIKNNVFTVSETGGNTVSKNTGGGVDVTSGDSSTTVTIDNTANSNTAGGVL